MLLLAIDTSGKHGSIALADCKPDEGCRVLEVVPLTGGTFSAQLVPQIAELLGKHGVAKRDIGGFAAASGPGSFTGLRVGLAAIKALAEVLNKPIVTVSILEAVATSGRHNGVIVAALDAGRNEIYLGKYEVEESRAETVLESLIRRDELAAVTGAWIVLSPDASVIELATAGGLQAELIGRPRADVIAELGWKKICAGEIVSPEDLEANYIRRSDAEIFAKKSS